MRWRPTKLSQSEPHFLKNSYYFENPHIYQAHLFPLWYPEQHQRGKGGKNSSNIEELWSSNLAIIYQIFASSFYPCLITWRYSRSPCNESSSITAPQGPSWFIFSVFTILLVPERPFPSSPILLFSLLSFFSDFVLCSFDHSPGFGNRILGVGHPRRQDGKATCPSERPFRGWIVFGGCHLYAHIWNIHDGQVRRT